MSPRSVEQQPRPGCGQGTAAPTPGSWAASVKGESAGIDRADRWGIFVGEWAPTFFGLGLALAQYEND
ncbi:hypothetical protein [Streptomyces sp. URMC 123]|uniref:hypothetical protein n=1 Tax=Streptomyces sp. URMC 123 TaxID=3423403 RepID=UPI003F19E394